MKNLLIYINPDKKFSSEHETLTKIQIDNSLNLGWKTDDIVLVTNFPYSYAGVTAIQVNFYQVIDQNRSAKIPAILELFDRKLIDDNEVYWFHDHDAFQLLPFDIHLDCEAVFTDHGFSKKWNAGSFFFTSKAKNIFDQIYTSMEERHTNEQDALTYLWENGMPKNLVNIAFNVGIYRHDVLFPLMDRPLQVAHFHPHKPKHLNLFRPIIPNRLMAIFNNYQIK